jgi:glycosyltransferase involved in cell wall biosynthesis
MDEPELSVVMGVKNEEKGIRKTIDSILSQEDVDLELIVIDDGSIDLTPIILKELAMVEPRLKVITQESKGLTLSLIHGCSQAKGRFIARHDANDLSLPGRFSEQTKCLRGNQHASMCSTYVRLVTEEGEIALTCKPTQEETAEGLTGTIHGSVMMKRDLYEEVGGYRRNFYYAQDVDLWTRLVEVGRHVVIQNVYYEALLYPSSISGSRKAEQEKLFYFIKQATKARRLGGNEMIWLKRAEQFSEKCKYLKRSKWKESGGAYFIGACLAERNPELARKYMVRALELNPWNLRARTKLAQL